MPRASQYISSSRPIRRAHVALPQLGIDSFCRIRRQTTRAGARSSLGSQIPAHPGNCQPRSGQKPAPPVQWPLAGDHSGQRLREFGGGAEPLVRLCMTGPQNEVVELAAALVPIGRVQHCARQRWKLQPVSRRPRFVEGFPQGEQVPAGITGPFKRPIAFRAMKIRFRIRARPPGHSRPGTARRSQRECSPV